MDVAQKTDTAKFTLLPMGSAIPDWLLSADPQVAGAPRGNWRFDVDVQIIEFTDDFLVFPILPLGQMTTAAILDMGGMVDHFIYATSKPVRVIHQVNHILPIEYRERVEAEKARLANRAPPTPPHVYPSGYGAYGSPEESAIQTPAKPPVGLLRRWWRALF